MYLPSLLPESGTDAFWFLDSTHTYKFSSRPQLVRDVEHNSTTDWVLRFQQMVLLASLSAVALGCEWVLEKSWLSRLSSTQTGTYSI